MSGMVSSQPPSPTVLNEGVPPVFHMCDKKVFNEQTNALDGSGVYYPPTFQQDGFIHATLDPSNLLEVGNHFYKAVYSEQGWICLKLDPTLLTGKVIFESPAPVGQVEAYDHKEGLKFPHIYGGITRASVMEEYRIIRGEDGSFLEIENLCSLST